MAMAHFDVSLAYDQIVKRGVPGQVARVSDADTDLPYTDLLDLDGNSLPALVSNSQGYVPPFQIADGPALVKMSVGGVTYYLQDLNLFGETAQAALQAAVDAQKAAGLVEAPADEVVATLVQGGTLTQTAGDARWVTHEGADHTVATIFGQVDSDTRGIMDLTYPNKSILSLNVVDFGADRTGTVDSTAQIQACLDQIEDSGTVLFPPGEYLISDTLSVQTGTTITGYGARIRRTASVYMLMPGGFSQNPTLYNGISRVSILGLEFHGDAGKGFGRALIPMSHCKDLLFRDLRFVDIGEHALDISGCDTVMVYNCEFYGQIEAVNVGEAVQVDVASPTGFPHHGAWDYTVTKNVYVGKCKFGPNPESGLPGPNRGVGSHASVQGVPYENIVVEDSEFYDIRDTGVVGRNWEGAVRRNVFRGREAVYATPSVVGDAMPDGTPSTVSSTTRRFEIVDNDILVTRIGIEVYGREGGSAQNINIEGNLVRCTTTTASGSIHGIYVRGFHVANVRGNIVRDFPGNGIYSAPPEVTIPCQLLTVDANTIVNCGNSGIYINASKTVNITGNTTSGIGWAASEPVHVRAYDENENLTIIGHTVDPTGDGANSLALHISSKAIRVTRSGNNWNGLGIIDASPDPVISGERL